MRKAGGILLGVGLGTGEDSFLFVDKILFAL